MLCFIHFQGCFIAISSEGMVGHLSFKRAKISWLSLHKHGKYSCQVLVIIYQARTCMVGLFWLRSLVHGISQKVHSGMVLAITSPNPLFLHLRKLKPREFKYLFQCTGWKVILGLESILLCHPFYFYKIHCKDAIKTSESKTTWSMFLKLTWRES